MTRLLTPEEVAERLSVSERTLRSWRTRKYGPRAVKMSGRVRYPEYTVTSFEELIAKSSQAEWYGEDAA